jgi:hypothetical protein
LITCSISALALSKHESVCIFCMGHIVYTSTWRWSSSYSQDGNYSSWITMPQYVDARTQQTLFILL